jgi:hypothetical protein
MKPGDAITFLRWSGWSATKALLPSLAAGRHRSLAHGAANFSRRSMTLIAPWLVANAGLDAPWAWSIGDAHHRHFTTLAHGRLRRDGRPAVSFGINQHDHQHPSPWHWDMIRLLASLLNTRPLQQSQMRSLGETLISDYSSTIARIADDDAEACRIDINGLPESLKRLIERDSAPEAFDAHLRRHCVGDGARLRLRRASRSDSERQSCAVLGRALQDQFDARLAGSPAVIGMAPQPTSPLREAARAGYLALVREMDRSGAPQLRLLAVQERPLSAIARVLPGIPFPPRAAIPGVVALSNDPFNLTIRIGERAFQARTYCHAQHSVPIARLDAGDLVRFAHLWGQQLAGFHCAGLLQMGVPIGPFAHGVTSDLRQRRSELPLRAIALARFTSHAQRLWSRQPASP